MFNKNFADICSEDLNLSSKVKEVEAAISAEKIDYSFLKNIDTKKLLEEVLQFEKTNRGIDWLSFYSGDRSQDHKVDRLLSGLGLKLTSSNLIESFDDNDIPNIAISNTEDEHDLNMVCSLRGEDIKNYLVYQTKNLQLASSQGSALNMGIQVGAGGILGIGVEWGFYAAREVYRGATVRAACGIAAQSLGKVAAFNAITIVVVLALIPIFIFMDKPAEVLSLIVNRTNSTIDLKDFYFKHGKLVNKPRAREKDTLCSIGSGEVIGELEFALAGFLLCSKRDSALIGMEGAVKLDFTKQSVKEKFKKPVFLGYSVPLASGKNKCIIDSVQCNSSKDFFEQEYSDFGIGNQLSDADFHLQTYMSSGSGGQPGMIAVVQSK
ncbi:hypothetical protein swp_0924 [Shewanella piezotolerans WP3]|uniref:Uncharacterized protein n=1 Tax=Shewanella piezotolerans (strain WP3 / JCM 13877) TaxID=225849 RepID=B8CK27_SHEPW|nr:hypothetical protein [Shewanella piezotolerans]ACJ27730.1 hypothetical protein swp_0924 [Shewanella piezotolerans WP3]